MPRPPAFAGQRLFDTPLIDPRTGKMHWQWVKNFQTANTQINAPASTVPPPKASNSPGVFGQIATDGVYHYVCVAKNTWKRTVLVAF